MTEICVAEIDENVMMMNMRIGIRGVFGFMVCEFEDGGLMKNLMDLCLEWCLRKIFRGVFG